MKAKESMSPDDSEANLVVRNEESVTRRREVEGGEEEEECA
jgi:hypothetical protein